MSSCAHSPPPPVGELILDADDPVIDATIAGVPMRLRVDLLRYDAIQLNPAAAARLGVEWAKDDALEIGRIRIEGRAAIAPFRLGAEKERPIQLSERGRDCCAGVDGAIGPDLLPYAAIRWRRAGAPPPRATRSFRLDQDETTGLSAAIEGEVPGIRLRFGLDQPQTIAAAAAGAILARAWGGAWAGAPSRLVVAYGVERPVRPIAFARPGTLASFRFDRLLVRPSDFGGDERLPADPVDPDAIVVSHPLAHQRALTMVTLGADRLSRCAEIVYTAVPRSLTLRCAFD